MPIYEYACQPCGERFELLIRARTVPVCPHCSSEELDRILSLPRVHSQTSRALALKAARTRDQIRGRDRTEEQIRYEKNHEGEHH